MKLFIHDEKHERINGELDLGEITDKEKELIQKTIDFLESNEITNRYCQLKLANKAVVEYQEGEPEVIFDDFRI